MYSEEDHEINYCCNYAEDTQLQFIIDKENPKNLITFEVTSKKVPTYSNYFDVGYFESGDFEDPPTQNGLGLEFNKLNCDAIAENLKCGLIGYESKVFSDKDLIATNISVSRSHHCPFEEPYTFWNFNWKPKGFINRFKWLFSSDDKRSSWLLASLKIM